MYRVSSPHFNSLVRKNKAPMIERPRDVPLLWRFLAILDLQSIPRESNDKDVVAMLVELTIEANEESFVIVHQHGGNDVTCKSRIGSTFILPNIKITNRKRDSHPSAHPWRSGLASQELSAHYCWLHGIFISRKTPLLKVELALF